MACGVVGAAESGVSDPCCRDRQAQSSAAIPNTTWTAGSLTRVYSDPFGAVRGNTDAGVPGDHRFLGAPRDAASGLTLLGARYYDPGVGCFISVDPVLNLSVPAHLHAYAYGFNNPVSFSDASGLEPRDRNGKFDGNPYGGSTGSPYSIGTLEACTDVWCGLNWQLSNQLQTFGGCFEVLGGLVTSVMPPVIMWNAFSSGAGMLRDPGAHWAGVQQGWNNFNSWMSRPLVETVPEAGAAWMDAYNDNPGHTLGYTTTVVGTLFIPGGAALKAGSVTEKVGAAAAEGATRTLPRNPLGQFTAGAGGESAAAAAGRSAHNNYPLTLGWSADDAVFNQTMLGTLLRPDAVNWTQRVVAELKPDSASAISSGWRQVNEYKAYLEQLTGQSWTAQVDVYTR